MRQNRLSKLLDVLVPEVGVIKDAIEDVDLFRITRSSPRSPQKYDPSIIILAQGSKRVFIGDEVYQYDPMNYLVLSVPMPLECETTASEEEPMLGIRIEVKSSLISEILIAVNDNHHRLKQIPKGIYSAPLDARLTDAAARLLESLSSAEDRVVLGPMFMREIIYLVLRGNKGGALRALAYRNQRFFQVSRTLDMIHDKYYKKLTIDSLALEAGMSVSAYHSSFKAVTGTSPLQYIKNVRLHKARMLMMEDGKNAYSAALHVGYESPSQFNREYKRLFGITPGKDNITLKNTI